MAHTLSASIFRIFALSLSRSHCVFRVCTSSATIFVTLSMFSLCTFISLIFSSPATKTNRIFIAFCLYRKIREENFILLFCRRALSSSSCVVSCITCSCASNSWSRAEWSSVCNRAISPLNSKNGFYLELSHCYSINFVQNWLLTQSYFNCESQKK